MSIGKRQKRIQVEHLQIDDLKQVRFPIQFVLKDGITYLGTYIESDFNYIQIKTAYGHKKQLLKQDLEEIIIEEQFNY